MKKIFALLLALCMLVTLTACERDNESTPNNTQSTTKSSFAGDVLGNTSSKAIKDNLSQYGITETNVLFYANVLDTINSLKQIHTNPETIEILGAVVMNPKSDNPRTIVYISYIGADDKEYTDYFWKDLNGDEIKAIFAKDCYTGNNGRMPIEQLDLTELAYYETCGAYTPNLTSTSEIYLDK